MYRRPRSIISIVAAAFLGWSAVAQVADYGPENGVLSFETGVAPASCGRHSSLELSDLHYKLGTHSLSWKWNRPCETLSLPGEIPYSKENPDPKETSVSTFVFWVYADRPIDGSLRFSFLKQGRECCHFDYHLGFTGWRGAWVAFDRDMQGKPEEGMDEVVITAPSSVRKGHLWFDGIITSAFEDIRHHTPDFQAPFINEKTTSHWLVLNNSWNLSLDIEPKHALEQQDKEDIATITGRFVDIVRQPISWKVENLRKIYDEYDIRLNPDGTIAGKPIFFTRYGETFINLGIKDASKTFRKNGQLLRDYNDNLLKMACSYLNTENESDKEEIAQMYVMMTRHLLDQGFACGSALGTLHHLGYSMRNFYIAPVLMKDVLRKAGLAGQVQEAMEWFSGVGEVKVAPKEDGMDIDAFNTSLMGRVASVLMLEDTPYKWAYLQALSRWIDNGFALVDGTRPCFKEDGSMYHHRKSYPAYAVGGLDGAVNSVWMLRGTQIAVSQQSHQTLKDALMQMRFWCNLRSFPLAMSGRHPDGKGELIPWHFARLALSGSPDGKDLIDKELASAYMRLVPDSPRKEKEFISLFNSYSPESTPQGSRNYPYNCSLSHRCGEALVTFAGHSRYLWSAEIYNNANHYGRYLTHGSMQILGSGDPVIDSFTSGYQVEGWDWCHIPGTTAAEIPMEKMKANVLNVDEFSGYEEMLLSDEWFAGGVTHKGLYGTYAMKLHEHDKYNGSLRARKSYFAFGDRIIALGTDLENSLEGSRLHTTLFQNTVTSETPTTVQGKKIASMDYSETLQGPLTVLCDRFGNTYHVKDATVQVTRGMQDSLHEETDAPTAGTFEKAYICHGDIVRGGSYEYMVRLAGESSESGRAASSAGDMPYKVIRHDSRVHEVKDMETSVTGAAVFEEGRVDSLIVSCTPAMIMYSSEGQTLSLSVSNPDLALYEGEPDEVYDLDGKRVERSVYGRRWIDNGCAPTQVTVTVKGLWDVEDSGSSSVTDSMEDNCTTLVFTTREGRTEEIRLRRIAL
ncbi:MAG: chondroitinase family polysaccharide lyase [Candidatus Cryptobacteroides sp.]